jgi:hypothetical protein
MMNRTLAVGLLGAAIVLGGAMVVMAQDVDVAKNKLLAKRAAEADAYRKLAETVNGLHLTSETLVRDFVTESDVIKSEVDSMVKGVRLGDPTWYEDLSCEVPAEVTVAKVITELKEIHSRHYQGSTIKGTDFENIKQYIQKDVIRVVGMGAPRPDLPPNLPEGVEEVITQVPAMPSPAIPQLWQQIGPQARLMAKRAAELDGQRRLLERIKGLRLTSDTLVKDFVTQWDEIQTEARGYLVGAQQTKVYYHHDEPIVEVTFSIPVESVITMIKELHTRHYQGDSVKATDIVNIKKQFKTDTFEATGMGVPPKQYVQVAAKTMSVEMPDWVSERITATGEGTDPEFATAQGKLRAQRAAELAAKRALAEQIHGMRLRSDTLVRDFVTEYDEINAQLDAVLMGSMVDRTEFTADTAKVTVSIPGMEVWDVVSDQMVRIGRSG